jgi:putative hydrolase of the HAD superfamily
VIKAFLFDFDGVIADTEVATFESWRQVYADYGVDLALEDWLPAVGTGSSTSGAFDAVAHLERLLGRSVDRVNVITRRTKSKEELYSSAPLLPGVSELLDRARERGIKTAVVTRNREERVRHHCDVVRLRHDWGRTRLRKRGADARQGGAVPPRLGCAGGLGARGVGL